MVGLSTGAITGGCQCGAVRYAWRERPEFASVCYCRMCQKASGQPFMALTGGKREHLQWTRGEPAIFCSSNMAERGFCSKCGTQLTYAFDGTGRISVAMGSLDDPEAIQPTKQYGMESKVSWFDAIHSLPAQRTDEWLTADKRARLVNNQHPDSEAEFAAVSALNLPRPAWMSEDVVLLEEQTRRFLASELVPHIDRWTENGIMDREVWSKLGSAGLLCGGISEEYGGGGGTFAHETVINREFALAGLDAIGAPLHSGIVAPYIARYGTQEQKQRWLPKLATGEMIGAIAMSEPGAGSDLQGVKASAKKSGNGYVLNGSKTFITNGQHANLIIVVAKTDPGAGHTGVSLMVVETDDAEGFRRGRKLKKLGLDWADTSELFFEDVKLPAEALLGDAEGQGFIQLMSDLPQERMIVATAAIGMIERALGLTIDYVKERKAFGKAIIEFQNTQFELAECKSEATIGRVFHDHCVERHLAGGLDSVTASMAKYWLTDLQNKIVDRCLQLFGGYGYMDEYPISRMYRDARVQRIYAGTNEIMKVLIARSL